MKIRTSITLSEELIQELDKLLGKAGNRSAFMEQLLRDFLATRAQKIDEKKERAILDGCADRLNEEAEDVLSYQVKW